MYYFNRNKCVKHHAAQHLHGEGVGERQPTMFMLNNMKTLMNMKMNMIIKYS